MEQPYILKRPTSMDHYTVQVFPVRCLDKRFDGQFHAFMNAERVTYENPESPAGGAIIFSSPEKPGDIDFMLRELEKSINLHKTQEAWLFSHEDCGALGGSVQFGNDPVVEYAHHAGEHKRAREVIRAQFPAIRIRTFFMDRNGIRET